MRTTVVSLAAGQIETLRAGAVLSDGTTEGDFGDSFPKYNWEQTIAPGEVDGLHQVDVLVKDAKSGATLYKLTTLLFDSDYPSTSASDAKAKQRELDKAKKTEPEGRMNLTPAILECGSLLPLSDPTRLARPKRRPAAALQRDAGGRAGWPTLWACQSRRI